MPAEVRSRIVAHSPENALAIPLLCVLLLQGLQGQTGAGRELIPAAGFITIIVPILVFLALQRYFIRGMTSGAVKG